MATSSDHGGNVSAEEARARASLRLAGRQDARYERDHGGNVSAEEARARASLRLAKGRIDSANYWSAYAAEVESWGVG